MELKEKVIDQMNKMGAERTPFLFVFDFALKEPFILPLHAVNNQQIRYSMDDDFLEYRNYHNPESSASVELQLQKEPISFSTFESAFGLVHRHLQKGNSFLTNLTAETPIKANWQAEQLFLRAKAKYKLFVKDRFFCFSPETFVQIKASGQISSFPMKGTIDAHFPDAENIILSDRKEKYEHTTIVDLIRNDLSKIANKVWVERFRYIEKIKKQDGTELLQVSSEVCGQLPENWQEKIGDLFFELLPAGSISGAPKPKTLEIINEAEKITLYNGERGFYTGVYGVFDGEKLNSAVMIRFVELRNGEMFFKSGGGITSRSSADSEYKEMISKIYVPVL